MNANFETSLVLGYLLLAILAGVARAWAPMPVPPRQAALPLSEENTRA